MNSSKSKKHSRLTRPKAPVLSSEEVEYWAKLEQRLKELEDKIARLENEIPSPLSPRPVGLRL